MTYPGLFSRYQPLRGKDWIRRLPAEDRAAFVEIGLQEAGRGQLGGRAVYMKRGREHMSNIGRRGALVTNIKKAIKRAIQEETEREFGVTFDF